MIARLIHWSIHNRFLVLMATALLSVWGIHATLNTPLDAIPDLSDTQVIIRTVFPGQAPQVVEDQVTYPLTTTMLSVPGARVVRGYSFFGDSYVYIIFDDKTDLYWARSRVLEYLNQVTARLPATAKPTLGPDGTGVGWIYEYALVDHSGHYDISQLRALQDWFLKYELKSVPDVAEVASIGGLVKQYQVVLDPDRMRALGIPINRVVQALKDSNNETGGSVLELGEAEYAVRATGYLKGIDDFRTVPVGLDSAGTPVLLGDVARIQIGPEIRRGIAELDGKGETVGGVIVMRAGKNALETITAVKAKLATLQQGLPKGVEIVPTYDRSELIRQSVKTLRDRLIEEFIVVTLVCALFLFHLRSAFVAIVSLPLGVLAAFSVMNWQGVNANIMSLGGIAIAIGAMVDAAVVMIENAHKHVEAWNHANPERKPGSGEQLSIIGAAAAEVGPALFFSLLIITLSFLPVFTLEAQQAVWAAGLHQDLLHGRGGRPVGDADPGADVLLHSRPHSGRAQQSAQPHADRPLSAAARHGAAPSLGHAGRGGATAAPHRNPHRRARQRIHAAAGRGRSAVHALGTARPVRGQGGPAAATDRQDTDAVSGGEAGIRQGGTRRKRHRPCRPGDVRDHHPVQAAVGMA